MAETKVVYRDVAPGALEQATPQMEDVQPFCGLSDLKQETIETPRAATLEQDFWRLDGSFSTFPDDPTGRTWGVWSKRMAGADGTFAVPPVLTLTFEELFSSVGLTLRFDPYGPDWCSDLNVKWYRDDVLLADEEFRPGGWEYACIREVQSYNRIVVTFRAMSKPFRYLKLQRALYGITRTFGPEEIRRVNLFQAASLISEELEIDTMDLSLISRDPVPFLFQRKQPMEVYHGEGLQGVFYISRSKRTGDCSYDIEAADLVGLLDESRHRGGVYSGIPFAALVEEIMGGFPCELDAALSGVTLSGWLPVATRRENLAQAAFAAGAVVDTAGSGSVRIFLPAEAVTADFDGGRVFAGSDLDTAAPVTAVEVTEHRFTPSDESRELYRDTLLGTAEILFSEPMHNLSVSGGKLVESGANYAVVTGTGGTVTLQGMRYQHTTRMVSLRNPLAGAETMENVIQVTEATLVGPANAEAVAARVYAHYQRRETVNATLVLQDEMPGDRVRVQTEFDGIKTGFLQSLDVELTRKRFGEAVILCE